MYVFVTDQSLCKISGMIVPPQSERWLSGIFWAIPYTQRVRSFVRTPEMMILLLGLTSLVSGHINNVSFCFLFLFLFLQCIYIHIYIYIIYIYIYTFFSLSLLGVRTPYNLL